MRWKIFATSMVLVVAWTAPTTAAQRLYAEYASVAKGTDVRLTPDLNRTPLASLPDGTMVKVVKREGDWVNIQFRDERFGYRAGYVLASDLIFARSSTAVTESVRSETPPSVSVGMSPAPNSPGVGTAPNTANDVRRPGDEPSREPGARLWAPAETVVVYASFSEQDLARAIEMGRRANGATQGVVVVGAQQPSAAAVGAEGNAANPDKAPRVELFTTLAWVRQLASDASKEGRPYTVHDVTAEVLEPVLRVIAFPDARDTTTSSAVREVGSIQHIVLRDESSRIVANPVDAEAVGQGLRAKFHLDAIHDLRGPDGNRDFFVTLIDSAGGEQSFRIEKTHFIGLP